MRRTLNIAVQQRPSSFVSEYDISTPGCVYFAEKKLFSLHDKITLKKPRGDRLAQIESRFPFLGTRYDFELQDGKVYRFWCEKMWKNVFACESGDESYRLFGHKGLNYSVFQNDTQIAAFSKNSVKIGAGDCYEVQMNDDANFVVIVCMVLVVDVTEFEGSSASVTYDFGNIGPEERPFDRSWEPS